MTGRPRIVPRLDTLPDVDMVETDDPPPPPPPVVTSILSVDEGRDEEVKGKMQTG